MPTGRAFGEGLTFSVPRAISALTVDSYLRGRAGLSGPGLVLRALMRTASHGGLTHGAGSAPPILALTQTVGRGGLTHGAGSA